MKNRVVLGGRYQYSPIEVIKQTNSYVQYRAYDKVTKRDLELQIHKEKSEYLQLFRDLKYPFIQSIFDMVPLEDDTQVAVLLESGAQAYLDEVLRNNHYLKQYDALVILKYLLLATQQLHNQMIVSSKICPQNVSFCTYSLIKLCFQNFDDVPILTKAPQILKGQRAVFASDIFSIGTIFYKMLYGNFPFEGDDEDDLISSIKSKKMKQPQTVSPFRIVISKQAHFLLVSMLDFYPENRPPISQILQNTLLSFPVDTELQQYVKPKGSIIPEPFLKKYLVFRASKVIDRIDDYYEQASYLALNIKQKQFMTMYTPDVKMFEADPRKSQSYFQKLRAMKEAYNPQSCRFICRIDDFERFRRQPVLVTEYCNQGDLFSYLEKRQKPYGWLSEKQINILMYLMAIGYKQIRDIGVTSIHTIHSKKIMVKNRNIKIREPGILTPFLENKLFSSKKIDYFAPQLKNKNQYVALDKSDMWSYGILFYYLLAHQMPQLETGEEMSGINIQSLETHRKNRNLIGKCLNPDVNKRIDLNEVKIEGVNESLLEDMLEEKFEEQNLDDDDDSQNPQQNQQKNVIFKSRKKKWCKNYNKIIAHSSTSTCRKTIKIILGLALFWVLSFGLFFINGGIGLLRTNYYRPIQLDVPYNYGTELYQLTILSTDGKSIENSYFEYSYEQFTVDLNCTENKHSENAVQTVDDFINGTGHVILCLSGFLYAILFSVMFAASAAKLDLPKILVDRKAKNNNSELYHFILMYFMYCALLFCFFYIYAYEFQIQMYPCLGIENQDYPAFTSIETLLNGDIDMYFSHVFTTVIFWSILMIVYNYVFIFNKKAKLRVFQYKIMIPTVVIMLGYTIICRIGFGMNIPLEPTWSYNLNWDVILNYWGILGFFPQILVGGLFILERLIDVVFWFFLRLGMEPDEEADISRIEINMKLEPESETEEKANQKNVSKIGLLDNEFEIFD